MIQQTPSRVLISFEWALNRQLSQKANHVILEGFLSELLGFDVHVKNLLEPESNEETEEEKQNCVDLLCENGRGELLFIELQYLQGIDYFQRMLKGTSKLIIKCHPANGTYSKVRKVYSIAIRNYDLGPGADYIYHGTHQLTKIYPLDEYEPDNQQPTKWKKKILVDPFPEFFLLKVSNFNEVVTNTLDEWIYYLKTNELPNNFSARGLKEVQEKLKYDQMEPAEKKRYNKFMENSLLTRSQYETALLLGREEGMEKGKAEGREERNRFFVQSSFKKGLAIELIAEIVNITVEEVEQILKEA